jgi:hypothetical protein
MRRGAWRAELFQSGSGTVQANVTEGSVTGSTAPSIDVVQQVCKGYFEGVPEVDLVYLFGSYADGSAGLASNIDLAVLYKRALSQEVIREAFL